MVLLLSLDDGIIALLITVLCYYFCMFTVFIRSQIVNCKFMVFIRSQIVNLSICMVWNIFELKST